MTENISVLSERDTRGDLGLSSIRDAFANLFFSGTSALHTWVHHFRFTP